MNFKLNLMLIPFTYRPSDGIQLSPFVRHHNSQFSILNYYISTLEKGVGQIRLLFRIAGKISSTFAGRTYSR